MSATKKSSVLFVLAVITAVAGFTLIPLAAAEPPGRVNLQGMARDAGGNALTGPVAMTFRFYDDAAAGTLLWEEAYDPTVHPPAVSVSEGLFTVALGDTAHRIAGGEPTFQDVFANHGAVYLGVKVGEDAEMTPRILVVSAPFAVNSGALDGKGADEFAESVHGHTGSQITGAVANATNAANSDTLDGSHATAFAGSVHNHAASDLTSGTVPALRGGTGLSSPGTSGNVLTSDGSGWTSSAAPSAGSTGGVTDAANSTLTRSGSGTSGSPYKLALNLASSNAWTGAQSFTTTTSFPGPGIWHAQGYVGIGTSLPDADVQLDVRSTLARGMASRGASKGGTFSNAAGTGVATLAYADTGVTGEGNFAGGFFKDSNASGYAYVGHEDYGIEGYGVTAGGNFQTQASGEALLANGDFGIVAKGNTVGGLFQDPGATGLAYVGYGNVGIDASGSGTGGYFHGSGTGFVNAGKQNLGIEARGTDGGGIFQDLSGTSLTNVAFGSYGIDASGDSAGGWFKDADGTSYAYAGIGTTGLEAKGDWRAAFFAVTGTTPTGQAVIGYTNWGINGQGNFGGGQFSDLDSSGTAAVGSGTYKVNGTGTVSFVQNHPFRSDRVIVYACPEGDEVATYTRGTARLVGGEARVKLGETYQWVTNPDIGLTAHITPRGDWADLYVASISTTELVVRSHSGSPSAAFDYLVYGLRIGFEESSIVQEKRHEAFIPSFAEHRTRFEKFPELRAYSALERFKENDLAVFGTDAASRGLVQAPSLKGAIHEYDPATDPPVNELFGYGIGLRPEPVPLDPATESAELSTGMAASAAMPRPPHNQGGGAVGTPSFTATVMEAPEVPMATGPAASSLPYMATSWPVCEPVEAGDLLVTDANHPGHLCLSAIPHDPGVVGVAASGSGSQANGASPASPQASVALGGMVKVKVDAGYGPIALNDLLVASPTPGHAMRTQSPLPGTVVGKALEPLQGGTGLIWILVMSR